MKADKQTVANLLKTARGQLDGILKMIDDDRYCMDISHQLLACQAVLKKANSEVIKGHLSHCVNDAFESDDLEEREKKLTELFELIEKFIK